VVVRSVLDETHVHALGVSASLRRQGVAAALMKQVLGWARVNAMAIVHLEQRASNHASRALYGSLGFVVVGRRPRYYRDGEDALLLSLVLVGPRQTFDPTPGDA
jgi:ribosomal-protein-alanine N-acetyltransferase